MQAVLKVLDREIVLDCAEEDRRRLEDLAAALDARLQQTSGDPVFRLAVVALKLLDEAQATGAALARARCEIERLSDMVVEARLEAGGIDADAGERGRVGLLHASSLT
jgi:hypothetical protein